MRRLAALLLALCSLALPAAAQSPKWAGTYTPGHAVMQLSQGVIGDAGPSAGSSTLGSKYLTELGITATGTPFCINDALINAAGGYHQLCFGASSLGGGLISFNAFGGAAATPLQFMINGTLYQFPAAGTVAPGIDTNTLNAQSGSYQIATTDCGKTVEFTGSFSTVTLPAITGFPTTCVVVVKNANATRGQKLVGFPTDLAIPNVTSCGSGNACLFPKQTVKVGIVDGVWATLVAPGRLKNTGNLTFNVDPTGSDDNDCLGTTTGACKTPQHAIDMVCFGVDNGNLNGHVSLAHGTHDYFQLVTHCLGQNAIVVSGDDATPSAVIVRGPVVAGNVIYAKDKGYLNLDGFTIQSQASGSNALACGQEAHIDLQHIIINDVPGASGAVASDHCRMDFNSDITFSCQNGGCTAAALLNSGAGGILGNNTTIHVIGPWALTYGCVAQNGGVIVTPAFDGAGFAGVTGQKFLSNLGGIITGGAGIGCPGNTAGVQNNSFVQAQPSNPTGSASSTGLMMGVGGSCGGFSPIYSTLARVTFTFTLSNDTATNGASATLKLGTGTAPANGAALTGTTIGNPVTMNPAPSNNFAVPATLSALVSLQLGSTYWTDIGLARVTAGTAAATGISCSMKEEL